MTRRVSVVIPTLDGGPLFLRVIAAVLDQRAEPFEVIVVDSGSRDGTLEALASLPVRVLKVPRAAFDHGLTRNFGIGMAEGEIVALLVQDALPASERWLAGLVAALDSEPRAAGAYSRQIPRPEHPAFVRVPFEAYAASSPERRVQELSHESWEAMAPAERLRAATFDDVASAVRKSAWRDHPFAAARFGEDLEWARRVMLAGHRIVYAPASAVIHSHDRGALHELRRAYACHRTLHALFGLRLVPDARSLARGIPAAVRGHVSQVKSDPGRARGDVARAALHGVASALGQYLGPRAIRALDALLSA